MDLNIVLYVCTPRDAICHSRHLTSFKRRHGRVKMKKTKNTFFMFTHAFTMLFSHTLISTMHCNCTGRQLEDQHEVQRFAFQYLTQTKMGLPLSLSTYHCPLPSKSSTVSLSYPSMCFNSCSPSLHSSLSLSLSVPSRL